MIEIEYAGFTYIVRRREDGMLVADPKSGQHPAANKDKHRRAAIEMYEASLKQNFSSSGMSGDGGSY